MPDIFDEFLDELKRRQGAPGSPRPAGEPSDDDSGEPPDEPPPLRPAGSGGGRGRTTRRRGGNGGRRFQWLVALALLALILFVSIGVGFWTDVLWYRSVGFESILWTRLGATGGLFAAGLAIALAVFLGNLWLAGRLAPPADPTAAAGIGDFIDRLNRASSDATRPFGRPDGGFGGPQRPRPVVVGDELPDIAPVAVLVIAGIAIFAALVIGGAAGAAWQTVQLWIHRVPFAADGSAVVDPVFGKDISFFLFDLPFLRLLQSLFNALVVGALLVAAGRYLAATPRAGFRLGTGVRVHLAVLGGLFLLSVAFGYQLDKFDLVYSSRMPVAAIGVSYTDAHAQFLAYDVLTGLSALAAALLVGAAFTRWNWPLGATLVTWFLASLIVGRLYPEIVQRFTVDPNPLVQEETYLANNIAMTRLAFDVGGWGEQGYTGDAPLTQGQIDADAATFQNARLWDYRPLGDTIDQLQTVRRYYDFLDVDTDRYVVSDNLRQVMLSARELDLSRNPNATGWLNQRIIYTHGIGAAMVPVNEVTQEGQPVLWIKDLPPVSTNGAPVISEPRIYFGEGDTGYVIVGARQPEFDYPQGQSDAGNPTETGPQTRWTGQTGLHLGTTLDRLLFAIRFGDLNILISDQVTADSQLLMHRSLDDRLQLLAPFLRYDKDPYLVVDGRGHLVYVQDAFTTTDRFPNAQSFNPGELEGSGLGGEPINYIRNSVKVVMDAYDGTMRFYVNDPNDPLIRAYEGIFPDLFQPLTNLPADLRPHLRYPEELFNVQTRIYGRYHVTSPQTFLRNDDLWTVPTGKTNEQSLPSEAYYVVMRIPGEPNPEFLLLQPLVPAQRPNMIAWVAARMDDPSYGTVKVFRFPAQTTVLGPAQIEARIDQDPTISAQITLWNQSGSSVIRGNLIVVPVGQSLIYLQPVYLQSTSSSFPEFQRIVVASPTSVVWGHTLREALQLLLAAGEQPGTTPGPTTGPTPTPGGSPGPTAGPGVPSDVASLIEYANTHFELAQQALRDGDFARYGQEIELVRQALARLDELAGASPSP